LTKGLSSLKTLILAKLLLPADFGLVNIAFLAIGALQLFRELGFGSALIYRQEDLEEAADTAFWVILLSSLPLYAISFLAARPLMRLFNRDLATVTAAVPVLRVLALTMVISSIGQVPTILLAKALNFRLKIVPEMVGALVGTGVAIALALLDFNVWSLVIGYLVEITLAAIVIWFISPWRPRWHFNPQVAKEMFGYGKNITGSQALVFMITNIDDAFVSKLLGPGPLGQYGFAYRLSNLPATHITRLVGQVMFPAFAKIQSNLTKLRDIYLKSTRYVSLISIPVALCIIAFAPEFIRGVYGEPWMGSILPIQLLGIYGLIRSIAANMGSIFKAGGRPDWLVRIAAFRLAVMALGLYPATHYYGIVGVSALSAGVAIVDFFISMSLAHRIIEISSARFLRMLAPILGHALVAMVVAKLTYPYLAPLSVYLALPLAGVLMAGVYGFLTWLFDAEIRQLFKRSWHKGTERLQTLMRHST
jgi:PST family polysaccharide transporter/lipopolysaccharide exporter